MVRTMIDITTLTGMAIAAASATWLILSYLRREVFFVANGVIPDRLVLPLLMLIALVVLVASFWVNSWSNLFKLNAIVLGIQVCLLSAWMGRILAVRSGHPDLSAW